MTLAVVLLVDESADVVSADAREAAGELLVLGDDVLAELKDVRLPPGWTQRLQGHLAEAAMK